MQKLVLSIIILLILSQPCSSLSEEAVLENGVFYTLNYALVNESIEIIVSAGGDVTIGGNMRKNPASNMYTKIIDEHENDFSYFFRNVSDIFGQDDLTIVNFEGTLTKTTKHKDNPFCFRAPPEHVKILSLGSIEAVAFENNHTMDFLQQGYNDTISAFENEGIVYSTRDHIGVYQTKGINIGLLAYQAFDDAYDMIYEKMPEDIKQARSKGCDIIIVSYHWGNEKEYAPNDRQIALGRATIDADADLVLGHHSHRINPIEEYKNRYIVYSLGNLSFSGNTKPDDMDTFIFQQKFVITDEIVENGGFRIIPCSISSVTANNGSISEKNDLAVTPFAPGSDAAERVVETLKKHGKNLTYVVVDYPVEWEIR